MRRFDPDPRLQNLLNNLERLLDADFRSGSQLAYKPKSISRMGRHGSRKSSPELPTQSRRQVRRRIEHMRVAPEKNIGTRVPQVLLRCLERYPRFHHLCRPQLPQETPGDVRKAKLLRSRLNAPAEKILVPDRIGLHGLALLNAILVEI